MAKWTVAPGTVGNRMAGTVDYDKNESRWEIKQDIGEVLAEVKRDKDILAARGHKSQTGWRKAFTIPDVVAIQLLTNHHMDVHDPDFMHDSNNMKKLKRVIASEYPELLIST